MVVLGLIGGIGSGKSLAAAEFAKHGGRIVSGDQAGHDALQEPNIRRQVLARWGDRIRNEKGDIDRRALGKIVFGNPAERQALEELVFPFIKQRLKEEIEAARNDPKVRFVILDAAIMLEAGWNDVCDRIIYVHAPREVRLRRIASQRSWDDKELAAREAAQMTLTDKASRADFAIDNSGPPEQMVEHVKRLIKNQGLGIS